jgi:hypothetical protein
VKFQGVAICNNVSQGCIWSSDINIQERVVTIFLTLDVSDVAVNAIQAVQEIVKLSDSWDSMMNVSTYWN